MGPRKPGNFREFARHASDPAHSRAGKVLIAGEAIPHLRISRYPRLAITPRRRRPRQFTRLLLLLLFSVILNGLLNVVHLSIAPEMSAHVRLD